MLKEQKLKGDIIVCTINEGLGKSFKAANDVHAVDGVHDNMTSLSQCAFGGTNEAKEDSPTICISDDRQTVDVVAGLGHEIVGHEGRCTNGFQMNSTPKDQPSLGQSSLDSSSFDPLGFRPPSPSQTEQGPLDGEVAPKSINLA